MPNSVGDAIGYTNPVGKTMSGLSDGFGVGTGAVLALVGCVWAMIKIRAAAPRTP
jgi:hypothetical protein